MARVEDTLFGYIPNLPVNIVGAVLFGVITIIQFIFGIYTRDWWMWVTWTLAGAMECATYIARAIAHKYFTSDPMYEMQLVLSIIAPAFMSAGLYYQLAQQIVIYGEQYSNIRPMIYNAIFTTCDVIALIIQAAGGGDAAGSLHTNPDTGGWIMFAGIAFQVVTLVVFIILYAIVNWRIYRDDPSNWDPRFASNRAHPLFKLWVPTVCISLLFLLIRSIYRLAELGVGWTGYLMSTERYFIILDGLMIVIGMVPLCIVYPEMVHGYVPVPGLHPSAKSEYPNDEEMNSYETASEKPLDFSP